MLHSSGESTAQLTAVSIIEDPANPTAGSSPWMRSMCIHYDAGKEHHFTIPIFYLHRLDRGTPIQQAHLLEPGNLRDRQESSFLSTEAHGLGFLNMPCANLINYAIRLRCVRNLNVRSIYQFNRLGEIHSRTRHHQP